VIHSGEPVELGPTSSETGRPTIHRGGWIALSIAVLIAALFISFLASFFYGFRGDTDDSSHAPQAVFLAMALAGIVATLCMLAQSINGTGRPGRWFVAAVILLVPYPIIYLLTAVGIE